MSMTQPHVKGLEDAPIVPDAEPRQKGGRPAVSSREEASFYDAGRAEHELKVKSQDIGWLGKFFGCGSTAATNIAGLVVVICILAFLVTLAMDNPSEAARTGLLGLATTAVGYVFGRNSKDS